MKRILKYSLPLAYPLIICIILSQAPLSALAQGSEQQELADFKELIKGAK